MDSVQQRKSLPVLVLQGIKTMSPLLNLITGDSGQLPLYIVFIVGLSFTNVINVFGKESSNQVAKSWEENQFV